MSKSLIGKEIAFSELLYRIPKIVDDLGSKQARAPEDFIIWLKDAEECLQKFKVPQASHIASVRSKLYALKFKSSTRKEQQRACCEYLPEAQSVILELYDDINQPIKEARKLLSPMLSAVAQSGAIVYGTDESFQGFIERLSQILNQHEQLKTNMVHINALLPPHDCIWLLADMVDLEVWPKGKAA